MTAHTEAKTDERFALELLSKHLPILWGSKVCCAVNEDDPPDLVVTWENGEKWGVEVTRTYQQVPSFDGGSQFPQK